mgnify:CR=1 FL=1
MLPILFVPELTPVPKLLRQFQTSHVHMAVVVDEYGATVGIVVTSVSFGAGHLIQGVDAAIATAALGAFWAYIYLRRRSIVATVVSHSGFNLLELVQLLAFGR